MEEFQLTIPIVQQKRLAQLLGHRFGVLLHVHVLGGETGERLKVQLLLVARIGQSDGVLQRLLLQPMAKHLQNRSDIVRADLVRLFVLERAERIAQN